MLKMILCSEHTFKVKIERYFAKNYFLQGGTWHWPPMSTMLLQLVSDSREAFQADP